MKSDLISRSELFNRLADKHTKAEIYAVINEMPTENTSEGVFTVLAKRLDPPCMYDDFVRDMLDQWCEDNCGEVESEECWRKLVEFREE